MRGTNNIYAAQLIRCHLWYRVPKGDLLWHRVLKGALLWHHLGAKVKVLYRHPSFAVPFGTLGVSFFGQRIGTFLVPLGAFL